MSMFYSKKENTFYSSSVKYDVWPDDAVRVEDDVYESFLETAPKGKKRGGNERGYPIWVVDTEYQHETIEMTKKFAKGAVTAVASDIIRSHSFELAEYYTNREDLRQMQSDKGFTPAKVSFLIEHGMTYNDAINKVTSDVKALDDLFDSMNRIVWSFEQQLLNLASADEIESVKNEFIRQLRSIF